MTVALTETGAEQVAWDLNDLYSGSGDPAYARDAEAALEAARAFRERYARRLGELDAEELAEATSELERIRGLTYRLLLFARLAFDAEASEERSTVLQRAQERETAVAQQLLFFDLEWASLDDAYVERVLGEPPVERYRYALASRRRFRPYLLSEPEERVAAEKSISGIQSWTRLHTELLSRIRVDLDGRKVSFDEAAGLLESLTDRDARRQTSAAIRDAFEPELRMRAFVLNTIVNDRAVEDRLRNYPTWISAFNLSQEISDAAVDALVQAVVARYDVARRHFRLRARLLGLDRLATYDLYAPVATSSDTISWDEAREIVLGAYEAFSPAARDIVARFFDERWIDAAPREGKSPGAYCARAFPGGHSYVLLTYTGNRRGVTTLAHELGHGLHTMLAEPLGFLNASYPLTIAETASVFGESVTYDALRAREEDDREKLSLLVSQIDTLVRTSFQPIAGNRFEHALHTTRREEGDLPVARINDLWVEQLRNYWGDAVIEPEERASWWSVYPHFAMAPGYMYPYSFGVLLSFSIYGRWVEEGDALVEPILDFLRAGSSSSPEELVRRLGFDLADPGFWSRGIDAIEALIAEAEALAERV